jgi:hypothetical protein
MDKDPFTAPQDFSTLPAVFGVCRTSPRVGGHDAKGCRAAALAYLVAEP